MTEVRQPVLEALFLQPFVLHYSNKALMEAERILKQNLEKSEEIMKMVL
jgi:hypothetical protein